METVITERSIGVRVDFPAGDPAREARAWELATTYLAQQLRQRGYVWDFDRIDTSTEMVDGPPHRDDQAWEETTCSFTPTVVDRAAAPVVKVARWWVSLAASRAVHTRALIDASIGGSRLAGLAIDAAVWLRQGENVHPDREIAQRIGHHPFEWSQRGR